MATDYKPKNDLPDLYHYLGLTIDVCKDPKCNELIQKAYIKKAKICHPDKHPGKDHVAKIFKLLTYAYDILKDETQRTAYNHKLGLEKQSSNDFLKLKKGTKDYMDGIGEYKPPSDIQKLSFKEQMLELNKKHGYDASLLDPIPQHEAKKKMNDLAGKRIQDDIDWMGKNPKLCDDRGRVDMKKFNAIFDKIHKPDNGPLVLHNGIPSAWNDAGSISNYSQFDNLNNLYVDDDNRLDTSKQTYGSINLGQSMPPITKDDLMNIRDADYVEGHSMLEDDYCEKMKNKLRERNAESSRIEKTKYTDYKRDDTAGYGIFDQLGFKIDDRLSLDIEENSIAEKFEKIMAERQQDLLPPNEGSQSINKKQHRTNRNGR